MKNILIIIFGVYMVFVVGYMVYDTFTRLRDFFRSANKKETLKIYGLGFGLVILFVIVQLSIWFFLCAMLPEIKCFLWKNEDGEPTDIKFGIATMLACPVVYLLIRGFTAWKKDNEK